MKGSCLNRFNAVDFVHRYLILVKLLLIFSFFLMHLNKSILIRSLLEKLEKFLKKSQTPPNQRHDL